jgi:hypothetical protein
MEEQRVNKVKDHMQKLADVQAQAIPIINSCISGIVTASNSVNAAEVCCFSETLVNTWALFSFSNQRRGIFIWVA